MRRLLAVLVTCVGLLSVVACVQVPTSGPVREGVQRGIGEEPPLQQVSAPRPHAGADQLEVVQGFLAAMLAYPADLGVVRAYLTDEAAVTWQPHLRTTIYADSALVSGERGSEVRVESALVGSLTERGVWSPPQQRLSVLSLDLVREQGQWRISNPPLGLHISESYFERYYNPYALYFFEPSAQILVPDPIYLPEGDQTATLLLAGLKQGPTDWLSGAVTSFVPADSDAQHPVRITDAGVADVPLNAEAQVLGADETERLGAQLAWTLSQVPEITALRASVDGIPVGLGDAGDTAPIEYGEVYDPADSAASSRLFATREQRLFEVVESRAAPVPGPFGTADVPVESFAVDRTGQTAAVVTGGGHDIRVGTFFDEEADNRDPRLWIEGGRRLLRPQWDFAGLLWAVDRVRGGMVVRVAREGRENQVELSESTPTDVQAFALARDGTRAAVIDGTGEESRLLLGRVVRPADASLSMRIDRWRVVQTPDLRLGGYRDVSWSSPTELAVVAREGGGVPQLFTVSIDGSAAAATTLLEDEAVSVAASSTEALPTIVGTANGTLWIQRGERWEELVDRRLRQPSYVE